MRISSIKRTAKDRLSGNWGKAILFLIINAIVVGIINAVFSWPFNYHYHGQLIILDSNKTLPLGIEGPISIITTLLTSVVSYGMYVFFLKLVRGEDKNFSDLFYYFKSGHQFVRAVLVAFFVALFTFLWFLLLIIPGIIKSIAYSQVGYILKDNPEMKPLDAITLSRRMMDGYKWKFFLLGLSFIGWVILVAITFGLALFYVAPYFATAQAQFYEEVKEAYEDKNETI